MKLWIDDVRKPPNTENYDWILSVNEAKVAIVEYEHFLKQLTNSIESAKLLGKRYSVHMRRLTEYTIDYIDIDHDAGEYVNDGGDYIKLLDWLEETGRSYPIRIHSANPVGVANMRRIIQKNGWKEVF